MSRERERSSEHRRRSSRGESRERSRSPKHVSLYVRNIHSNARPDDIRSLFNKYGSVTDVYIPRDYYTREPREFAYVQLSSMSDARAAMDALDGSEFQGRKIQVQFAQGDRKTPTQMRRKDQGRSRRVRSPYRPRRSRSRSRSGSRHRRRSRSRSRSRHSRSSRTRRHSRSRSGSPKRPRSASPAKEKDKVREERSPLKKERSPSPQRDASPQPTTNGNQSPEAEPADADSAD